MECVNNIHALAQIKTILERMTIDNDDNVLQQINTLVTTYLETKCLHHVVMDYIDTGPDSGYTIRFCDICMKTFQ